MKSVFLCLTYVIKHNTFKGHPYCCRWQDFILFYDWIVFYGVPHLLYSFIHWWTLKLFLYLGYCKYWRRKWRPTPIFLSGKSHGWELGGLQPCSPWTWKKSDTTEHAHDYMIVNSVDPWTIWVWTAVRFTSTCFFFFSINTYSTIRCEVGWIRGCRTSNMKGWLWDLSICGF